MRATRCSSLLVAFACLLLPVPAVAHELARRWVAGPEGGGSINADQWLLGGRTRLYGTCLFACLDDLALGVHALAGLGGNYLTLRASPRLGYTAWLGERGTVGLTPELGAGIIGFLPVGRFAEFCNRTGLDECRRVHAGFEAGGSVRLWPIVLSAIVGTGQLPVLTLTVAVELELWDGGP